MKRGSFVLLSALVCVLLGSLPIASAQETGIELSSWTIDVWPEYDKPSVLVIYNGTIAEGTSLPTTLRIPIPDGATINAVADADESGNLMEVPWRSEPTERGQNVVFELERPNFVVEYYDDVLSGAPNRSFNLSLVAPYAAVQGSLSLRQPARAGDMAITPPLAQAGVDSLGNPLYTQQIGPLAAGQNIPLAVTYTKSDSEPSVSDVSKTETAANGPQVAGAEVNETADWLPWLIGGLVAVLVGALVVYLFLQWQQRQAARSRQVRRRDARDRGTGGAPKPTGNASDSMGQNAYCPQCGRKYDQADKFCRSCGTPRR